MLSDKCTIPTRWKPSTMPTNSWKDLHWGCDAAAAYFHDGQEFIADKIFIPPILLESNFSAVILNSIVCHEFISMKPEWIYCTYENMIILN